MKALKHTSFFLIVILSMMTSPFSIGIQSALAVSPNIVISQVYGGGGNSGATYTHDFIELFNRGTSPASLAGWSLQYAAATTAGLFGGSSTMITELPVVTLQPGQYFLVQEAPGSGGSVSLPSPVFTDTTAIAMAAGSAKVALVNTTTPLGCNGGSTPCSPAQQALIVDLIGWGTANFFEGAAGPTTSNTTAALRNNAGCVDTDNNAADFTTGAPTPRNTLTTFSPCGGPTNPTGTGAAAPPYVQAGASSLLTMAATPGENPTSTGLAVTCDLSSIGGSAAQTFFDDGTNGDLTASDSTFSFFTTVPPSTTAGLKNLLCTITDAQTRSGNASISLDVFIILPIGTVQGSVGDADNGLTHGSPYAGQIVYIQGVIYEKTLARTSAGLSNYSFFIQNTTATGDIDPNSSDGIFVYMGTHTDLIGGYVPEVGDEIILRGGVSEYYNLTELSSASMITLVRSGVDLEVEVPPFETDPPEVLADANRYWERREGMRAQVPAGSLAVDGRDVFESTMDGEVWVVRGDSDVAQAADPYARRAFRDPHPLDNLPALFDDGNGYRIILGSLGIKATLGDKDALIAPARTFDTVTNAPSGGVNFSFSKYQIMITQDLELTPGVDPSLNAPPQAFNRFAEYSVSTLNVENLYDYRDDPFDGCDFASNSGCPGVDPPFDYVPASNAIYQARLVEIAQQIITDLHSPDILLIQEAEDQDICTLSGGLFGCGVVNNADGKPDTLQELAYAILELDGPEYEAVYDRDGADDRGISAALMYRTDRVELLPATWDDPVLGSAPTIDYRGAALPFNADIQNPKALNAVLPADVDTSTGKDGNNVFTRTPQVGLFRIWKDAVGSGTSVDLYAISNHFSSTPDGRVGQRTEQALYNAEIVAALQEVNPDVQVTTGGDLNVYPRPDDPFAPPNTSDQLAPLYDQELSNLYDVLLSEVPSSAYSYVYQGQTQTLDQIFVTPSLSHTLTQVRAAHINSDWPAMFGDDGARGLSDHDPWVARFCRDVTAPTLQITMTPNILWPPNHSLVMVNATVVVNDDSGSDLDFSLVSVTSSEPDNGLGDGDTEGDIIILDETTFKLRSERAKNLSGRYYIITYQVADECGNTTTASSTVYAPHDKSWFFSMKAKAAFEQAPETWFLIPDLPIAGLPHWLFLPVTIR